MGENLLQVTVASVINQWLTVERELAPFLTILR